MSFLSDISCPSCNSKQLSTSENSSGRLTLTCISCGRSFKATDSDETPKNIMPQVNAAHVPAEEVAPAALPDFNSFNQKIIEIAQTSGMVNAIKYCKDTTGWNLQKCKEHVDKLGNGQTGNFHVNEQEQPVMPPGGDSLDQRIIEIARTQGKLHAVKYYKDQTGKGLKESLEYVDKIVPPGMYKKTEGCFIATACYGDYDAEEVLVLRRYRDDVLKQTAMGRIFVRFYYQVSPSFATFIQNKATVKRVVRQHILQPLVNRLTKYN